MRVKLFRIFLCMLAFMSCCVGRAAAADSTTNTVIIKTNAPAGLLRGVQRLQEHPVTFGLDRVDFLRDNDFLGEPLWKYVASLIYILLAFYVAKFIDYLSHIWIRRLATHTETKVDDLMMKIFHGPIKVVAFVVLLNIGLSLFDWSPTAKLYLSKGLVLVVAASLTYLGIKVVNVFLEIWRVRHSQEGDRRFNDQLFTVLRISLTTFVIVVAILVTAQNMNVDITAAVASLSIGGLAVGLAAQDTLANLFGAVAVFVDRPFRIGDQIKVDTFEGAVENVGLRSTRIRSLEGYLVAVPNKTMGSSTITNLSSRPSTKTTMNFALPRNLPTEKVKRALSLLEEIYRANPITRDVWVSFNQFAGANLNIVVVHWAKETDQKKYLAAMQDMNLAVKDRFDAEGIPFA